MEIDLLWEKINPLKKRIDDLEEREIMDVQLPRIKNMVGYYLRSTYDPTRYYGRIIDLVFTKEGTPYFLLEIVHITKEGNPYIHLDNVSPYTNKEWWDSEVPMCGWERCSEEEFLSFKAKLITEFGSQKSLRAWLKKRDY